MPHDSRGKQRSQGRYSHPCLRIFAKDLKPVYTAVDEALAHQKMDEREEKWGKKYPPVIKYWPDNWERLTTFYKYPQANVT